MKTLKLILAWLDWSTYCKSNSNESWKTNYEYPKSLCSIFWRTLLSIAALPFTWFAHIWNFIFVGKDAFLEENFKSHKLNIISIVIITIFSLFFSYIAHNITDGKHGNGGLGWDWFHTSDPLLLSYFKLIGAGILFGIVIAICLGIIIGICYLFYELFVLIKDSFSGDRYVGDGKYITSEERAIPKAFHAIKNKYCPTIDWSDIRNMKKQ